MQGKFTDNSKQRTVRYHQLQQNHIYMIYKNGVKPDMEGTIIKAGGNDFNDKVTEKLIYGIVLYCPREANNNWILLTDDTSGIITMEFIEITSGKLELEW